VCDAPGDLDDEDAQVSFTSVDAETLHETSSCFNDDSTARGFVFDGFDHTWSLHMASLDTQSETDVNVTGIAIDEETGDSYVTASVTSIFAVGDGKMTVMGKHLDKRGFTEPGAPPIGVNSKEDFAIPNDGSGNPLSTLLIHTVLLKVDIHGHPQWITYMESQFKMVAEDILVDTSSRPTKIIIAGLFSGYFPRLYNVNRLTKRAKRGDAQEREGGIRCPDMSKVSDLSECWYFEGEANYMSPTTPTIVEIAKPGIFLASYNAEGLATAFKGGIYFYKVGSSFPAAGTVRIAAHTTARRNNPHNGSKVDDPSAYVDDFNGLYLSAKILVSRYSDTMFFWRAVGRLLARWRDLHQQRRQDLCGRTDYSEGCFGDRISGNFTNAQRRHDLCIYRQVCGGKSWVWRRLGAPDRRSGHQQALHCVWTGG